MTSLLPLLPDSPRLPATDALSGGPAALPAQGAGAGDFAGLVEALAQPPASPIASPPALPPEGADPEAVLASVPDGASTPAILRPETSPATALTAWPTGKNLPQPGAVLPPGVPPVASPEANPQQRPGTLLSAQVETPSDALVAEVEVEAAPATPPAAPSGTTRLASREVAGGREQVDPRGVGRVKSLGSGAVRASDDLGPTQIPPGEQSLPKNPDDPEEAAQAQVPALAPPAALAPAVLPDPALVPQPVGAALTPAPSPDDLAAGPTATPTAPRLLAATTAAAAKAGAPTATTASSTRNAATPSPAALAAFDPEADAAPAPAAESGAASAPGAGALPDSEAPATIPSPAAPAAANIAQPLPERTAEPRGAAATPHAPQLESAIAQVGDIREALRSARPALTLQHAEFGAVSIRLEPAAPDQWRAVLASRDPGFVPAIHAALADRTIAATADTSGNFSGHSGAHQNGTADQRYGSTPNGGQGSPQPYLGQSGSRDGEAAPDHRRPSTAAALAARGGSEAEDAAASTPGSGGLFA